MGVPGQILGHFKAKERFGNPAIPMKRLFEPTIKLCEEGIRVSRTLALAIKIAESWVRKDEELRQDHYGFQNQLRIDNMILIGLILNLRIEISESISSTARLTRFLLKVTSIFENRMPIPYVFLQMKVTRYSMEVGWVVKFLMNYIN